MSYTYSNILKIALPIFSFALIENIIAFTDTAFLGRVSEAQLAAAAIGSLYYVSIFIVGFGFSIGAQILVSHRNGAGEPEKIGAIFTNSLYFLLALALASIFLTALCGEKIFAMLVSDPNILGEAMRYMKWRAPGFAAIFGVIAFRAFYVGIADTKILAYSSWLMGIVNMFLNYALIFGKAGFPRMEIEGAAIASSASEFAAFALFLAYTLAGGRARKYSMRFGKFDFCQVRAVLSLSAWTMAQQFVYVAIWLVLFAFIEKLGARELAQSNIIKSVLMFLYMPMYAFGATMNTVAGNLVGERRAAQIPAACKKIIIMQYAATLPAAAMLAAFPLEVLGVYTNSPGILTNIRPPFYMAVMTVLFAIPSFTLCNLILGFGRTRAIFFMELSTVFFYVAFLCFTVYELRSFAATWTADAWYWLMLAAADIYYIKRVGKFFSPQKI